MEHFESELKAGVADNDWSLQEIVNLLNWVYRLD
jgi:hypothetical protein